MARCGTRLSIYRLDQIFNRANFACTNAIENTITAIPYRVPRNAFQSRVSEARETFSTRQNYTSEVVSLRRRNTQRLHPRRGIKTNRPPLPRGNTIKESICLFGTGGIVDFSGIARIIYDRLTRNRGAERACPTVPRRKLDKTHREFACSPKMSTNDSCFLKAAPKASAIIGLVCCLDGLKSTNYLRAP